MRTITDAPLQESVGVAVLLADFRRRGFYGHKVAADIRTLILGGPHNLVDQQNIKRNAIVFFFAVVGSKAG